MMAVRLLTRNKLRQAVRLSCETTSSLKSPLFSFGIRAISTHIVNKNISLISQDGFFNDKSFTTFKDESKPTVLMFPWLLAKKKHYMKYCDVYLKNGFNVMTITLTPWQFFWPITGSHVVADQLLKYLESRNDREPRFILHAFSVGAYLWGEVLVKMNSDLPRFQKTVIKNIKGQIWDSAADVTETSKGLPTAMFPRNAFLRSTMEKYVKYHLNSFYDVATQHYVRASQLFHTTPVHAPALIFVSRNDPIGSVTANEHCRECWTQNGIKVTWQCWEKSRHVSHLMLHKETYLEKLHTFLNEVLEEDTVPLKIKAQI